MLPGHVTYVTVIVGICSRCSQEPTFKVLSKSKSVLCCYGGCDNKKSLNNSDYFFPPLPGSGPPVVVDGVALLKIMNG